MRQQDEQTDHSRPSKTDHSRPSQSAPPAVSVSGRVEQTQDAPPAPTDQLRVKQRCRHVPLPGQLLNSTDICSRFEQVSGKRTSKRMTAGKLTDPGPTDHLPDDPL